MITIETIASDQEAPLSKYINLSSFGKITKIPLDTILYIESNRRKVTIQTDSAQYICYEKLNTLEQLLGEEGFMRCHQSYLVQTNKILSFNSNHTVSLAKTTVAIPVSRRHQPEVRHILRNPVIGGTLTCLSGPYKGSIIRIKPEQPILIGRDGANVDLIINLPLISRKHCEIVYHADSMLYELTDFSKNGTFINSQVRVVPYDAYIVKPGTTISFGDDEMIYQLG